MAEEKYITINNFIDDRHRFTYILGARGVGKTINTFVSAINEYKKNKTKAVYLRRYQVEVDTIGIDIPLLSKLTHSEISRERVYMEGVVEKMDMVCVDGEPAIYMIGLSTSAKVKSTSFADVTRIYYDEFIDMNNRELPNETMKFLQFSKTAFRDSRKFHAIFLANATNLYNNYFLDFEILPTRRITKIGDHKIVMYQTSEELLKQDEGTALTRAIIKLEGENGSTIANNFDNEFNDFITKLERGEKQILTLEMNDDIYYLYERSSSIVISRSGNNSNKQKFAMRFVDIREDFPLIPTEVYNIVKQHFQNTTLLFTDVKTRSLFIRYLQKSRFAGE